jgi:hypothetical protein
LDRRAAIAVAVALALCALAAVGVALLAVPPHYLAPQQVAEIAQTGEAGIAGCCQELDMETNQF